MAAGDLAIAGKNVNCCVVVENSVVLRFRSSSPALWYQKLSSICAFVQMQNADSF